MNQQYPKLSIRILCELFGKTRLAYYDHRKRELGREQNNLVVLELVAIIRSDMPRLGSKKLYYLIAPTLRRQGIKMGRDALHELLKENGLTVRKKRYYPRTTWSNHWMRKYPNLITDFFPQRPNELWVSDITYIRLRNDFAYLSIVTDAYSRKIVGYSLWETLENKGAIIALRMALDQLEENEKGLIHHSDRGVQYCSYDYVDLLKERSVIISMTESGDPRENAIAERINGILKVELGMGKVFKNIAEARKVLVKEVGTYNRKRPHLSCNLLTPEQAHETTGRLERKWKS